ncbi:hypothetical protein ABZX12_10950 [Kribbella sp. NPDC003505]|uniref:hypothetical protein n=1 Tax=Kribbella sp. NPDC003505 TaxID=3154448 RepID=UPI00339DD672
MERAERGGLCLTLEEAEIVRAALFTIEHYMNNVWDQTEIRAVSGFTVDRFASVRQAIDAAGDGPSR